MQDNCKKRKLVGKTVEEGKKKNQETFVSYSQLGLQINAVKKAVVNSTDLQPQERLLLSYAFLQDLVTNGGGVYPRFPLLAIYIISCPFLILHLHILPRKLCICIFYLPYHECTTAIQNTSCETDIHAIFKKTKINKRQVSSSHQFHIFKYFFKSILK